MKNLILKSLVALLSAVIPLLTSCSSSRQSVASQESALQSADTGSANMGAVAPLSIDKVLETVAESNTPWEKVLLDGKLSMKGLPMDLSVKIYMESGSTVLISLRAPIMGEVARVESADGELFVANRMKKVYIQDSLEVMLSKIDMTVDDVQAIMLGRVFKLGGGTLTTSNLSDFQVGVDASGAWAIIPAVQPQQASYGFTLTPRGEVKILFAESVDGRYKANADYAWKGSGGAKDVNLSIVVDDNLFRPEFSFNAPDFNPKPLARMSMGDGWKKVTVKEFMRSF